MPGVHALLAPSAAHRWLTCIGSVALTKELPDQSSSYANEGTAAHSLAESCLRLGVPAKEQIGWQVRVEDESISITEDMAAHVQVYLDYVRRESEGKTLLIEQKIPLTPLTAERDARGTSDAVIVDGDTLTIVDLKFGMGVKVYAEENAQLMLYAAAAAIEYSLLGEFENFRVVIVQPRLDHIDEWEFDRERMAAFSKLVQIQADRIFKGETELVVSDEGCRFCRAKATCPELSKMSIALAESNFDNLDKISEADIGFNMRHVDMVEGWCRAVRAEVETRLLRGDAVTGFKLVQGRRGARQWVDAGEVEDVLKSMQLPEDVVYKKTLASPTALEKVLIKKNPVNWAALQVHITQKEGAPSVAASTDPRPEINAVSAEFEVLE